MERETEILYLAEIVVAELLLDQNVERIKVAEGFNQYEIAYWDREDSAKLRADFRRAYETEPEGKDLFWEFIPLVLYRDRYRVEIRPCAKSDIMEIDNFYELVELDPSYQNYRPRQPEVRK